MDQSDFTLGTDTDMSSKVWSSEQWGELNSFYTIYVAMLEQKISSCTIWYVNSYQRGGQRDAE